MGKKGRFQKSRRRAKETFSVSHLDLFVAGKTKFAPQSNPIFGEVASLNPSLNPSWNKRREIGKIGKGERDEEDRKPD